MENTQQLIFKGYRFFNGKKDPNKIYYVLNFMTKPIVTNFSAYCKDIEIFVGKETYNTFIKENSLLDTVDVYCQIVGDKVKYLLN